MPTSPVAVGEDEEERRQIKKIIKKKPPNLLHMVGLYRDVQYLKTIDFKFV